MDIVRKLENALAQYLTDELRRFPDVIYLGEREISALDKKFGGLVFAIFNIEIVVVEKSCYVQFGEKI